MAYNLAAFCVDAGVTDWRETVEQIDLLFRSAMQADDGVALIILTDETTEFDGVTVPHRIIRSAIDKNSLMLERAKAQRGFIRSSGGDRPTIFLDTDILIVSSLAHLFSQEFDIGLTVRPHKHMPFNGGVILCNNLDHAAVRSFFDDLVQIYSERYAVDADWYGDQFAIRDVVRSGRATRYLHLPASDYNAAPAAHPSSILTSPEGKTILHFKGQDRKQLMKPFWDCWVKEGDREDHQEVYTRLMRDWKSLKGSNTARDSLERKDRHCFGVANA